MILVDFGGWTTWSDTRYECRCGYLIPESTSGGKIVTKQLTWTEKYHDCFHASYKIGGDKTWFYGTYSTYNPHTGYWFTYRNVWLMTDFRSFANEHGWGWPGYHYVAGNQHYQWDGNQWFLKDTIIDYDTDAMLCHVYDHQYQELTSYRMVYAYFGEPIGEIEYPEKMPDKVSDGELFAAAVDEISGLETNNIANIMSILGSAKEAKEPLNNICNILEIRDFDFINKKLKKLGKSARDPDAIKKALWTTASNKWLQYRYELCTSLSDLHELQTKTDTALMNARRIARNDDRPMKLGASITRDGVTYQLTGTVQCTFYNETQKLWYQLEQLGLQPNLQNLWDIVPYSFVVDWFLPLGEYFSHIDRAFMFGNKSLSNAVYTCPYKFRDFFVSTKQQLPIDLGNGMHVTVDIYNRRCLQQIPSLVYYKDSYEPSTKTWIKRVVDGAALFIHF